MEEEVGIRLSLKDRRQTVAGIRDVDSALDRAGNQALLSGNKAARGARGYDALGRAGRLAGRAAVLGTAAIVAGGYAAVTVLDKAFEEAREAQKVSALTRAELKATKGVANVTATSIERLASSMSKKIGVDDEAIQTSANLLLTFKNVRNELGEGNKIFNLATKAAADVSAAGFGSMDSAAKMLGKSLQDPLKGITALSRAGITFSDEQKVTIEGLVESNRLLDAQKIILGEVNSQVGGAAKAQAMLGDKVTVAWGNVYESLGEAAFPLLKDVQRWLLRDGIPVIESYVGAFRKDGVPAIKDFVGVLRNRGLPMVQDFADATRPLAEELIPALATALGVSRDVLREAAPYAADLVGAFNDMPEWARNLLIAGGVSAWALPKLPGVGSGPGGPLSRFLSSAKPVPVTVTNIAALRAATSGGSPAVIPGPDGKTTPKPGSFLNKLKPIAAFIPKPILPALGSKVYSREELLGPALPLPTVSAKSKANLKELLTLSADLGGGLDKLASTQVDPKFTTPGLKEAYRGTGEFLDLTGATKRQRVDPAFSTPGLPGARRDALDFYQQMLRTGELNVTPSVTLSGIAAAQSQIATLASSIHALENRGDAVVPYLSGGARPRERGGPVQAGRAYVVGERRAELFVPEVNGKILPRLPDIPDLDLDLPHQGSGTSGVPLVVQLVLPDGRVLTETVIEGIQAKAARK